MELEEKTPNRHNSKENSNTVLISLDGEFVVFTGHNSKENSNMKAYRELARLPGTPSGIIQKKIAIQTISNGNQ